MRIIYSLMFLFFTSSILSYSQKTPNLLSKVNQDSLNIWVDSIYSKMDIDEKIGQLFMPVVSSDQSSKQTIDDYVLNQKIGGILFQKNTLIGQANLTNYAKSISKTPLLISLDGEWGLSMRLTDAPKYPRNIVLGAIQNKETIRLYGEEIGRQCNEMGININFAPDVDVNSNPQNPVIGTRSFGEIPDRVAWQGISYAQGLEDKKILSVAKHFPGHGDTNTDSHKTLPTILHNKERLNKVELLPFREYINAGLSGIMIAHLNIPSLGTNGLPASLSTTIGVDLLHKQLGFQGLTFTDGMAMKGVSSQPKMSIKALLAGNDIILGVINQKAEIESVKTAIKNKEIPIELINEKVKKILSYKYILNAHKFKKIEPDKIWNIINSPRSEWINSRIYDEAATLLKNNNQLIPINNLKQKIACVSIGTERDSIFKEYLNKYTQIKSYNFRNTVLLEKFKKDLNKYDLVIYSINESNIKDLNTINKYINYKKSIIVIFNDITKYNPFNTIYKKAETLAIGYDDSRNSQISLAKAIFGGIPFCGKLSMSAFGLNAGYGLSTSKNKLDYTMPESVGIESNKLDSIELIAQEGIRQKAYPGCYILVVKNNKIIYDKGYGNFEYVSTKKVSANTVYDLASVTKAIATLPSLMKLYEQNKISITNTLGKYLPQTIGSNKENITIKDLLFHESGIISYIPYYMSVIDSSSYSGELYGKQSRLYCIKCGNTWFRNDYKFLPKMISKSQSKKFKYQIAKDLYSSQDAHDKLMKDIINTDLKKEVVYKYSCLNFILLKEAIENISKTPLDKFIKDELYSGLGMTTTTFQPAKYMPLDNIAPTEYDLLFRKQKIQGYVHDEGAAILGGVSGNAGVFSDANDIAKYCQMLLNGGEYGGNRYFQQSTINLFTKTKSENSRRGLGFDKPNKEEQDLSPCSPSTPLSVYGHTGFTGTCFWIDPDNKLIYIFLSNRVYPNREENKLSSMNIRERIQETIYQSLN